MEVNFNNLIEDKPGSAWQHHFNQHWYYYQQWYLSEGERPRPGYLSASTKLKEHMPELYPVYESLMRLAGGGDLEARFLSLYNPPAFLTGCTQCVYQHDGAALVRNYDYSPKLFEGVILQTNWLRPVIAMSDCLWGALDGVNDAGLVVSLAFGGSKKLGDGFGIPIILRYLLECCADVKQAREALERIPAHMSYNITVLDAQGDFITAYLHPEEAPVFLHDPVSTNHQEEIEWEEYAELSNTLARKTFVHDKLEDHDEGLQGLVRSFLSPPLYSMEYSRGFGTLYTAVYDPLRRSAEYIWPGSAMNLNFEDRTQKHMYIKYL